MYLAALIAATMLTGSALNAQQDSSSSPQMQSMNEIPNRGRVPNAPDGVGVVDARVVDPNGNPVPGAEVRLESRRFNGYFCESWHRTNAQGVAVMAPLHIGRLTVIVRAPGYRTQRIQVRADSIGEPVRITLARR
jgi:hypothetical protein